MLVDCGMFQGEKADTANREAFAFNPSGIDYLFLTHAHLDHCGLIPKLVREGFKGKIVTTAATADLVEILLYDSAHIQKSDAQWMARKAMRAGREPEPPLYTPEDVRASLSFISRVPYGSLQHTGKGVNYRFIDAGHILGSASVELWVQDGPDEKKIIFSGDIGKKDNPIINNPTAPTEADYVVMESTYGNRAHKGRQQTLDELVEAIKVTFKRGGNVIIPAFAVGRTQDILYMLNRLIREGRLYNINVYIDSPLAEEATKTYLAHPECFDEEARALLKEREGNVLKLRFIESVSESMALNKIKSHAIIIAASGMCEGGRVGHHLKHNLWRPESSVIFTGFQAKGTLGRRIVDGAKSVHIFGEEIAVKAKIYTLGGFSAHADQKELLEWLSFLSDRPVVFAVHGEEDAVSAFSEAIRERFAFSVLTPVKGQEYELP